MSITRRRFILASTTTGLVLALAPYLANASDDDDDHRHRNNVTDEPGEGASQVRENQESNNGEPPSEQVDTYDAEKDFIFTAGSGHITEAMGGQLAVARAQSQDVKQFGQRMSDDHTDAYNHLKDLAARYGVELPTAPATDAHKDLAQNLMSLSGSGFDSFYIRAMVLAHENDQGAYQDALQLHHDVGKYADKYLPMISDHLAMAKTIAAKLGVDVSQ